MIFPCDLPSSAFSGQQPHLLQSGDLVPKVFVTAGIGEP